MAKIWARACYLCNQEGKVRVATATYTSAVTGQEFDVCSKHRREVRKIGRPTTRIVQRTRLELP